ncbi:TPA: hypothetical protein ACNVV3_002677 [Pseudomonas putida]
MKKPAYWLGILVIAGLASAIGKEIGAQFGKPSDAEKLKSALAQAVKQINDRAPTKVDDVTTLLRAEQSGPTEMTTVFELAKYDQWGPSADLSAGKASVIKNLCAKPQTLNTMRMGVTFGYVYQKEDGTKVYQFKVGRADCT